MRVLLVHDEPLEGGYGAEAYVRRLAAGLRDAGDTVDVIAGERCHQGAAKLLDMWDPAARRLVASRARAIDAEVVHHHNISRELSASVLSATDVPQVMTIHDRRLFGAREHPVGSPHRVVETIGASAVLRTARRRLTATIGVSEEMSRLARGAGLPAVSTVPVPAAEPVGVLVPAAQCRDLLVAARLAPDKGIDVVIDAFTRLGEQAGTARLLIAGAGPQEAALRTRARALGSRVEFLGWLDETELSGLLGRVRALVVASIPGRRPEGSSLSAVEAARHRRVVIGSDDPAVAEVVTGLGAGPVVPAGDVAALTAALEQVLTDDAAVAAYSEAGSKAEVRHSIESVAAATREVYRRAVGGGSVVGRA